MPEGRQIGRRGAISKLEERIDAATHQWLIGERRIGKTSVAKAVLARLRKRGTVALDLDLSKLGIDSTSELAGEIARQAQAAAVGATTAGKVAKFAKRQRSRGKALSKLLEELGYEGEAEALAAAAALLAGADDGTPGLSGVLSALALHARATDRRVVVLLDEVHLLAGVDGAETQLARWCREPDCPIVFIFAGSEEGAVKALRDPGQPLAAIGQEFELAEIAPEDWIVGLGERFEEAEVEIARAELEAIVAAADSHPRRTMLIASYVHTSIARQTDPIAVELLVELAIRQAEEDLSWR